MDTSGRSRAAGALTVVLTMALAGCGLPLDPDGTLDAARSDTLRVGASPSGDLVLVDGGEVSGPLPALIEGFAESIDARIEWTVDSEEDLVDGLMSGTLDLAIGGMTDTTPWAEKVSVTRGYTTIADSGGAPVVVLMPLGENGTQRALETYLDEAVGP